MRFIVLLKSVHNALILIHQPQLIHVDPNVKFTPFQVLHIPGLTEVLRLHPDFLEQFSEDIQHDLTYNLREGYDPEVWKGYENSILCFSALRLNSQILIKLWNNHQWPSYKKRKVIFWAISLRNVFFSRLGVWMWFCQPGFANWPCNNPTFLIASNPMEESKRIDIKLNIFCLQKSHFFFTLFIESLCLFADGILIYFLRAFAPILRAGASI